MANPTNPQPTPQNTVNGNVITLNTAEYAARQTARSNAGALAALVTAINANFTAPQAAILIKVFTRFVREFEYLDTKID